MRIEELQNLIEDDLAWRKVEISQLFLLLQTSTQKEVISKSLILLLYAHWEGFIKNSSKLYLKYVSEKRIKISELTSNFKAIALKKAAIRYIDHSTYPHIVNEVDFLEKQNNLLNKKFSIVVDIDNQFDTQYIDTKQNLSSRVLKHIIDVVGMTYNDAIKTRNTYLDSNLLQQRNAIGHGNRIQSSESDDLNTLSIGQIAELKEFVVAMLDYYADVLITYATSEFYLESNENKRIEYEEQKETALFDKLNSLDGKQPNRLRILENCC